MSALDYGDEVLTADGEVWTVLNLPCAIPGAESSGLFREVNPDGTPGFRQQYGCNLPPIVATWEGAPK